MDWGRVQFFLSEVWRNFTRTLIMQMTAIGTVTVTIVLLGTFLFAREAVSRIGDEVVRQFEIAVYLDSNATPADARALIIAIRRDPEVRSVVYIPKAEGLRQMRDRMRGLIDTSLLTSNPIPDKLRVRVVDAERVPLVAAHLKKLAHAANVEYAQQEVERVLRLSDVLSRVGLGFVLLLLFTAAIIISNTIRLTVYARRREIEIMQLVGASNTYIRLPFICEGFVDGFLGALVALIVLEVGRWELLPKITLALPFLPLNVAGLNVTAIVFELVAIGATVGILASWISVGRYLRA